MIPYHIRIDDEEADHLEKKEKIEEVDTNLLIPDRKDENEVTIKKERKGTFLIAAGGLLFLISLLIQLTTNVGAAWSQMVYAIITGLHILFLGVFQFLDPSERASFELMLNGKQIKSFIPLRAIILVSINFTFSAVGIICMHHRRYWWTSELPVWNKLGLSISLLIAIVTVLQIFAGHLPFKYQNLNFPISMSSLPNSKDRVTNIAATIMALLPELSNINLTGAIQAPKSLRRKTLHHTTIAISMLLAAAIFFTQLLDIATSRKDGYMKSHKCIYTRASLLFLNSGINHTRMMVLISAPVTIILCLPLVFLTHRPSMMNLIKAFIFSGAMATFHCYQAIATLSWMLIMGSSASPPTFSLHLGITLASQILASLLLSLAFSYLNTILQKGECEDEPTSGCNKISSVLATLLAVLSMSVTIAALICTTGNLTVELCTAGTMSYSLEENLRYFSWSQSCLSVTLLTLGFLLVLSGNKISRPILLLFGLISFASAIATLIFYFTGVFEYANEMPSLLEFYISNGCQVALGLILGFGFSFAGGSFFVTLSSILLRIILTILALSTHLVISLVVGIIHLPKLCIKTVSTEKEEPKQEVDGNKIRSKA